MLVRPCSRLRSDAEDVYLGHRGRDSVGSRVVGRVGQGYPRNLETGRRRCRGLRTTERMTVASETGKKSVTTVLPTVEKYKEEGHESCRCYISDLKIRALPPPPPRPSGHRHDTPLRTDPTESKLSLNNAPLTSQDRESAYRSPGTLT
ncbi:hypothetical protein J6590_021154 [Homalodisca vitripennis]|nr:hypothetical protein J6590_021154 [Homalodisca vitripennis]